MRPGNDPMEFYVGYEPLMPPGVARAVRRVVVAAGISWAVTAAVVLAAQRTLPDARFEFGRFREYEGVISLGPYPRLHVQTEDGRRSYWLAAPGKHGADGLARGLAGHAVRLEGQLIERNSRRMLEVRPRSIRAVEAGASGPGDGATVALGPVRLRGEIADSKCLLGVMNPAEGAVHRDCAVACLRGGLPPMLLIRNSSGREALVVLVTREGASASRSLAALAGRSVEAAGILVREADEYVLRIESVAPTR